jgi:chromosome segregation ATPase
MEQKQKQTAENTTPQSVSQVIQSQIALARFRMDELDRELETGSTDWFSYSNEIFVLNSILPTVLAAESQAHQQTTSLQQQVKELKEENERLKSWKEEVIERVKDLCTNQLGNFMSVQEVLSALSGKESNG